jgi:hypothetical protein
VAAQTIAAAQSAEHVGQEVAVSDWIEVSQSLIDLFADTTRDHRSSTSIRSAPDRRRSAERSRTGFCCSR